MNEPYQQHALEEILANINSRDLIKARIVIGCFSRLAMAEQRRILFELNKYDNDFTLPLLITILVTDPTSASRYPTLQEAIMTKALAEPNLILQELVKEGAEQYYYARLCGILNIEKSAKILNNLLLTSDNEEVLLAAMQALGALVAPLAINQVSAFLSAQNQLLVRQAIETLRQINTPTAMQRLSDFLGRNKDYDMLILDIFARVQDEVSLHKLNDTLRSSSSHLRNYSKQKIMEVGSKALPLLIKNLEQRDIDLKIHSLNLLAVLGDESVVQPVRRLLQSRPEDANVRFAAYEAMAALPNLGGDYVLAAGLMDEDDNVRMAAARAIDRHFDHVLASGIRNMIAQQDGMATRIIKAVIDSQTEHIFLPLLEVAFFRKVALTFLATKAHEDIRIFYVNLLIKGERHELARQITTKTTARSSAKEMICAVDDSKMILNVYRSVLTELGYAPILFGDPAEALAWLRTNKPLLLCTDLNMPELNGFEFSRLTRKLYTEEELPIIMVTTQNNRHDTNTARQVGINTLLHKPFNAMQLATAISASCTS